MQLRVGRGCGVEQVLLPAGWEAAPGDPSCGLRAALPLSWWVDSWAFLLLVDTDVGEQGGLGSLFMTMRRLDSAA